MSKRLHIALCDHLEQIAGLYLERPRITLIIRVPGYPDRGVFLSDDNWTDAMEAVAYLQRDATYIAGPPEPKPTLAHIGAGAARSAMPNSDEVPE